MHIATLSMFVALALGSHGAAAAYCNNQPSMMWKCLRRDNSNSGYTSSCCPSSGSFMQDGSCCTNNWQAFRSCCTTHSNQGYWAANG